MYLEYFAPISGRHGFNIGNMVAVPKSRGSITLQSSDPLDPPIVDPNFLSHPEDVAIMVEGNNRNLRYAIKI